MRPIAIGETLRPLYRNVAEAVTAAESIFLPRKIGVRVKYLAQAAIHAARQVIHNYCKSNLVLLNVDLSNLFNQVSRHAFITECRKIFLQLLPWVETTYTMKGILQFGKYTLASCTGVQQGDPLGTLLFSLVL